METKHRFISGRFIWEGEKQWKSLRVCDSIKLFTCVLSSPDIQCHLTVYAFFRCCLLMVVYLWAITRHHKHIHILIKTSGNLESYMFLESAKNLEVTHADTGSAYNT